MNAHSVGIGLLLIRLVIGFVWLGHGTQKLFGWFGAKRRGTLEDDFAHLGYRPPLFFGYLAGIGEVAAGVLIVVGFATPVGGALVAVICVQAIVAASWQNGPWIQDDGYEYLLVLLAGGLALAFTGAGRYALDDALGTDFSGVVAGLVATGAAAFSIVLPRTLPFVAVAGSSASGDPEV